MPKNLKDSVAFTTGEAIVESNPQAVTVVVDARYPVGFNHAEYLSWAESRGYRGNQLVLGTAEYKRGVQSYYRIVHYWTSARWRAECEY